MSRTNPNDSPPSPEWEPCALGEVARLGKKLRGRKTRRMFLRASVATAASVLAAGGGVWLAFGYERDGEYDYGGIGCSEVVRLSREYMEGKVPQPTQSQIAAHVAKCPRCGPLFKQMREQMGRI